MELTVYDPDCDPAGRYAAEIVDTLVAGLSPLVTAIPAEPEPVHRARPAADPVFLAAPVPPVDLPAARQPADPPVLPQPASLPPAAESA